MTLWREYAIEPASFGLDERIASQILSLVECSRGTVVAACPSGWLREVYGAIRSWKDASPVRAAGIEAKLQQLKATALFPSRPTWEGHRPWPDAAFLEHKREPFDLVMSLAEREASAWLRLPDDLDPLDHRLTATHEILVPRTAQAMAAAVGPLLRASKQIVFVDPHFSPGADRFIRPLHAWFQELLAGRLRPAGGGPWTKEVWIYDLRTNQRFTLKQKPLQRPHLDEFVACYRAGARAERAETDRFRRFAYDDLIKRDRLNLDLFWLKDDSLEDSANLPPPDVLAGEIVENLEAALAQFRQVAAALGETPIERTKNEKRLPPV